ncbi:MAG: urea ABC transporter substrate-binding protein [Chlamydiae bacterium]|nr:urea ABC transporter substrate-binding protein [Chlamydiota bacterium]
MRLYYGLMRFIVFNFILIFSLNAGLKVGVLHSRTGVMAQNEVPVLLATLAAIDEINQSGGINGELLQPIVEDGASDPEQFKIGANRLLDQGVVVIFGTWTSASRKAVAEVLEKRDGLLFYPVQFEGLEDSKNIIYLGVTPNQQLITATSWALDNIGKRFFVVGSDYIYPKASLQILQDYLPRQGAQIVGQELIPLSNQNFSSTVAKIKLQKPDVIINLINGDGNRNFFNLLENDPELKKTAIISLSVTEDNIQTWNVGLENHFLCWSYFQNLKNQENLNFLINLRQRIDPKIPINDPMEIAYFGVKMWANSFKLIKNPTTEKLVKILKGQGIEAAEGIIGIDFSNYLYRNILLSKVYNGKLPQIVWRSVDPIPPEPFPSLRTKKEWQDLMNKWYLEWGNKWNS